MAIDLDHIAFALQQPQPMVDTLVGQLGATPLFGGERHFRWMVLRMGDGGRGLNVELLQPMPSTGSDFLAKFLARHGDGPHHLTFKTDDIEGVLDGLRRSDYEPIDVSLTDPIWRDAFLRPRDAHGTLVQVAESNFRRPPVSEMLQVAHARGSAALAHLAIGPGKVWWEEPERSHPAVALERVTLATSAPAEARRLYGDVLGGRLVSEDGDSVELEWPNGVRLHFVRSEDVSGVILLNGSPEAGGPASLAGVRLVLGSIRGAGVSGSASARSSRS
jgi:methylmalonyl-CoA/ethylmalonyl-CoA epimerase